jgi:hypothetical protein
MSANPSVPVSETTVKSLRSTCRELAAVSVAARPEEGVDARAGAAAQGNYLRRRAGSPMALDILLRASDLPALRVADVQDGALGTSARNLTISESTRQAVARLITGKDRRRARSCSPPKGRSGRKCRRHSPVATTANS